MLLRKNKNYFHRQLDVYDATSLLYWWYFKVGVPRFVRNGSQLVKY